MADSCKEPKDLAKAMKENQDEIIIEGDLKNHVLKIKAVGSVAWAVCFASLAVAIALIIASPAATAAFTPAGGGASLVMGITASTAAAGILGSAVVPAIVIGVTSGSVGALTKLRDKYKIVEKNEKYIKLKRKSK